jgi:hypothetical protein
VQIRHEVDHRVAQQIAEMENRSNLLQLGYAQSAGFILGMQSPYCFEVLGYLFYLPQKVEDLLIIHH